MSFATPIAQPIITVPLQALQAEGGATHTWLFDPGTQSVRRTRVKIVNVAGNEIVIGDGLKAGDIVVTAGRAPAEGRTESPPAVGGDPAALRRLRRP